MSGLDVTDVARVGVRLVLQAGLEAGLDELGPSPLAAVRLAAAAT